jgi:hypothetical protein
LGYSTAGFVVPLWALFAEKRAIRRDQAKQAKAQATDGTNARAGVVI